jgi:hypothetical protein
MKHAPALLVLLALAGPAWQAAPARADAFGAEVTLLSTHLRSQRDAPVELYRRRLDDRGRNVVTPGIKLSYDFELSEPLWRARQVRVTAGQLSDSIEHRFGYLAVMGRWVLWEGERFAWSFQAGPGFIYRKSWRDVPEYDPDNLLQESDRFLRGYEWAVLPLGDFNLLYRFTPGLEGVWSIFPGIPYVLMQSVGLRWSF